MTLSFCKRTFVMGVAALILMALCVPAGLIHSARAQVQVPPTCDADYMEVLNERAWMEGKRRMELAQKLILKQDSVLQYVCFPQRMRELNDPGAEWSNRKAIGMRSVLDNLIGTALGQYFGSNFGHTMGGGTSSISAGPCNVMYRIWDFLKCDNYNTADFIMFRDLAGRDPRQLHRPCNETGRTAKWQNALLTAFPPPATPAADGGMDEKRTYISLMNARCNTHTPVKTGVQVLLPGRPPSELYEEHICITPGCSWKPGDRFCH